MENVKLIFSFQLPSVRDWSDILCGAKRSKDIAESPTALPERPKKRLKAKDFLS